MRCRSELCDDIARVSVSTRARELRGPMLWLCSLPAGAALVYVFVLARRLPAGVGQLTWNADYVSVMTLAETIGSDGQTGHAVIVPVGYFWVGLAPRPLPFPTCPWLCAP